MIKERNIMHVSQKIINEAVSASIAGFVNEMLGEEGKKKTAPEKAGKWKKAIKTKSGSRVDRVIDPDDSSKQKAGELDSTSVEKLLGTGYFNISRIAQELYPDHTKEGAQSQLNKKLNHDKSDSGSTYRLKKGELKKLRHVLAAEVGV